MFRDDKDEINVTTHGGKSNACDWSYLGTSMRGRDYYDLIKAGETNFALKDS